MTPQFEVCLEQWQKLSKKDREAVLNVLHEASEKAKEAGSGWNRFEFAFSLLVYAAFKKVDS